MVYLVSCLNDHQRPVLAVSVAIPVTDGPISEREQRVIPERNAVLRGEALVGSVAPYAFAIYARQLNSNVAIAVKARESFAVQQPLMIFMNGD